MNDRTYRRLQHTVARAVRPLRASRTRKRAVQEELLAHVTAVFEEEFARVGSEPAALDETLNRFGLAEVLHPELQHCVPTLERWLLISEREILMSRWFWLVAVIAIFVGPALVMPALAKFHGQGEMPWAPLMLGTLITLAGLGGVAYGICRRLGAST